MARREEIREETGGELNFASPNVGTALMIAAGLSFQFLCMILPLVGKAGMNPSREYAVRNLMNIAGPHGFDSYVTQNRIAFLAVLFITLGLAAAAVLSKKQRGKIDGSPVPKFPFVIGSLCVALLIAHVTGYLQI